MFLQGLPEMNLENIKISNLLGKADKGFSIIDANGVEINNVSFEIKEETVFNIFNSKNLDISNIEFNSTAKNAIMINGKASENIQLKSSSKTDFTKSTFIGETVGKNVVTFE